MQATSEAVSPFVEEPTPSPILSIPLGTTTDTRIVLQCRGCNRSFYTRADKPHRHCVDCYSAWKRRRFASRLYSRTTTRDSDVEAVAGGTEEQDCDAILVELDEVLTSHHGLNSEEASTNTMAEMTLAGASAPPPPNTTPPAPPLLVDASSQTGLEAETYEFWTQLVSFQVHNTTTPISPPPFRNPFRPYRRLCATWRQISKRSWWMHSVVSCMEARNARLAYLQSDGE